MLRSRAETALDDVLEACKEAADHYRVVADAGGAADLAPLFRSLHEEHLALAAAMEEEIRRLGNLPSEPDADREIVEHLVTRVRAAFAHDERRVLLDESERMEGLLADAVDKALALEQPARAQGVLERLQRAVAGARERLGAEER